MFCRLCADYNPAILSTPAVWLLYFGALLVDARRAIGTVASLVTMVTGVCVCVRACACVCVCVCVRVCVHAFYSRLFAVIPLLEYRRYTGGTLLVNIVA